jgi:hypothetical protein
MIPQDMIPGGVIDTAGSNLGDFRIDFLGEYDVIYRTVQPVNQGLSLIIKT